MLSLNLLPSELKKELDLERSQRLSIFIGGSFLIILIVFSFFLFFIKFYIDIQLNPLKEEIERERARSETKKTEELNRELRTLNSRVTLLDTIQKGSASWYTLLSEISSLPLEGITFSSISILRPAPSAPRRRGEGGEDETGEQESTIATAQLRQVRITGHATDRDNALLALEEAVKSNPYFSNLESPSHTLEKDFPFIMTFNVVDIIPFDE